MKEIEIFQEQYWDKKLLELPIIKQWYLESIEKELARKVIADEKRKISTAKYRKNNKAKIKETKRKYYQKNKIRMLLQQKIWRSNRLLQKKFINE